MVCILPENGLAVRISQYYSNLFREKIQVLNENISKQCENESKNTEIQVKLCATLP